MRIFGGDTFSEELKKIIHKQFPNSDIKTETHTRPYMEIAPPCRDSVAAVRRALSQSENAADADARVRSHEHRLLNFVTNLLGYSRFDVCGLFDLSHDLIQWYGLLLTIGGRENAKDDVSKSRIIISSHFNSTADNALYKISGLKDRILRIPKNIHGETDVERLSRYIENCFRRGIVIEGILLTLGQECTGASDPIADILSETDRLRKKYGVFRRPHIHLDIPICWPLLLFKDYDFSANPEGLPTIALRAIKSTTKTLSAVTECDSCSINLGRWGYTPLPLSILIVKNHKQLAPLTISETTIRLESENGLDFDSVQQKPSLDRATRLCSLEGLAAAHTELGGRTLRGLVAKSIDHSCYLKLCLQDMEDIRLLYPDTTTPIVSFRRYPTQSRDSVESLFQREIQEIGNGAQKLHQVHSGWHYRQFLSRSVCGLRTTWQRVAHVFNQHAERMEPLTAETIAMLDPYITTADIDTFILKLQQPCKVNTTEPEPVCD